MSTALEKKSQHVAICLFTRFRLSPLSESTPPPPNTIHVRIKDVMPKDRRRPSMASRHPQSARPVASRLGAFAEGTLPKPEHVDIGGLAGASASEILASLSNKSVDPSTSSAAPPTQPSKKDKQKFRHEALITRLATQPKKSPYSRPIAKGSDPDTITKTKAMKRKVKLDEQRRQPLLRDDTAFSANPFEAIRLQAMASQSST
ncbi:hypothetical protein FRB97_008880 [Tulasnella sp. 331]|nr:hypothetical protein FRB97_008880 [Tulasnella sp. 331]